MTDIANQDGARQDGGRQGGGRQDGARKPPNRRMGPETSATRLAMLDAAEQVLSDEGYAALSSRRVAEVAGVKQQLVYYYFHTMDDLIRDTFRRRTERSLARLEAALASERPLHAIWEMYSNPSGARLSMEFTALANRNAALRDEVIGYMERSRRMQARMLQRLLDRDGVDQQVCPPVVAAMLISGLAQFVDREAAIGVACGHEEMRAFIAWCLERFEPAP